MRFAFRGLFVFLAVSSFYLVITAYYKRMHVFEVISTRNEEKSLRAFFPKPMGLDVYLRAGISHPLGFEMTPKHLKLRMDADMSNYS